jgi:hypothetical protein
MSWNLERLLAELESSSNSPVVVNALKPCPFNKLGS